MPPALKLRALCDRLSASPGRRPQDRSLMEEENVHLVMFVNDKQPRAGVIDGEDIIDINANDRSLPPTIEGHP